MESDNTTKHRKPWNDSRLRIRALTTLRARDLPRRAGVAPCVHAAAQERATREFEIVAPVREQRHFGSPVAC